ncbi:MFS transporter [Pseudonocardia sp.]|uniref:MFS transporter n=1 Tax=Pseudonocardia sp. TaxID=60912 RepID=UPI00262EC8C1|nr:MFS transporter [Pseudonocardia sp.]MCW2720814.1 major facilitator superfamily 1 [Pseudonocardia sp.]MDT7617754.1 transporter, family, inner rane transport protein [Pseudonocardiales bacterium]
MPIAILAMALGAFAIGLTEFAVMGLLPRIATELSVTLPVGGNLVTAYAVGVVVGAPLLTAAAVRLPRRTALLLFMSLFAAGNGLAAVAPSFGLLLVARFLSGLPHGAFFGVGALVAASLVPERRRASAVASMLLGLTVANLVGVPAATLLGGLAGWRLSFVLITVLALACVAGMLVTVPRDAVTARPSLGSELAALGKPAVLLALGTVVIGCGGLFAFYTFITPMMTDLAGFGTAAIPVLLGVFGLGMTVGSVVGGRLADRFDPWRVVIGLLAGQTLLLAVSVFAVHSPVLAPVMVFGVGATGVAMVPAVQSVVMDAAGDAPALASATIQSAFNLANALGASLGGLVLAAGLGLAAPPGAGALLSALGLGPAVLMVLLARRAGARKDTVPA